MPAHCSAHSHGASASLQLASFSNAIRRTFVHHSTRFQLTMFSHGSSALAVFVVIFGYLTCNSTYYTLDSRHLDTAMQKVTKYYISCNGLSSNFEQGLFFGIQRTQFYCSCFTNFDFMDSEIAPFPLTQGVAFNTALCYYAASDVVFIICRF